MTSDRPSFPRHSARTLRFTLGVPRNFAVSPDGARVAFLRAPSGTDRRTMLWAADIGDGVVERVVADPRRLTGDDETLSAAERARRERAREGAAGIVTYAADRDLTPRGVHAVRRNVRSRTGRLPRHPAGARDQSGVRPQAGSDGSSDRLRGAGSGPDRRCDDRSGHRTRRPGHGRVGNLGAGRVHRGRGDGALPGLLVVPGRPEPCWSAGSTESAVQRWHIADPAHPGRDPQQIAYPAAGTRNATVELHLIGLDGSRVQVSWDAEAYEYLAAVHWSGRGAPLLAGAEPRPAPASGCSALDVEHRARPSCCTPTATRTGSSWSTACRTGVRAASWFGSVTPPAGGACSSATGWSRRTCRCARSSGRPARAAPPNCCSPPRPTTRRRCTSIAPGRTGRSRCPPPPASTRPRPAAGRWSWSPRPSSAWAARSRYVGTTSWSARSPRWLPTPGSRRWRAHCRPGRARCAPSCCCRPGTGPARRCRCCSTRTGARTPSGCCPRPTRSSSRSGGRMPVSRWWSPTAAGRRGATRPGNGPSRATSPGRSSSRPDRGPARGRRAVQRPGHRPGGDPRLVVRRVSRGAGRAASPGRVPRGDRRRPGHRLGALRHPLHRALPGHPGRRSGELRAVLVVHRRRTVPRPRAPTRRPDPSAVTGARIGRRQRRGRAHPATVRGAAGRRPARTRCCRCPASPT